MTQEWRCPTVSSARLSGTANGIADCENLTSEAIYERLPCCRS